MSRNDFNPTLSIRELPPELVKELKLSNGVEDKILEVFRKGGGILNVSEVLVGFYKLHGEVKTRRYINSALYRMSKKGLLSPTVKKGEYKIGERLTGERSENIEKDREVGG